MGANRPTDTVERRSFLSRLSAGVGAVAAGFALDVPERVPACVYLRGTVLGLLMALLVVGPVAAQSVWGRIVDGETGLAIAGAVVVLLDGSGVEQQAVLSSDTGGFRFTTQQPATYQLRVGMIGRVTVEVGPFAGPPSSGMHELRLAPLPIQLTGLEVSAESRCSEDRERARSVYLVWTEVEKALRATELTRASTGHRFRIAEYERRRRKGSLRVIEEVVTEENVEGGREPFQSLAPGDVSRSGYIREIDGEMWIYGPSTEILRSREFQDTHCFGLRRDASHADLIGLEFTPVDGRDVSDIRGVLWLDEGSAELRSLEFEFDNVPRTMMNGRYEGAAEFRRLDDGGWIIEEWWLRSPDPDNLLQIRERAGEVLSRLALRDPLR